MYKPTYSTFKSYGNGIPVGLGISVILILSSIIFKDYYLVKSFSVMFAQIFLFTAFDVLGWHFIIQKNDIDKEFFADLVPLKILYARTILSYRIMQTMFQVVTLLFVLVYSNYQVMIGCIIFWWFLGCDLLYYFIAGIPLKKDEKIDWVSWSVWRIVKGKNPIIDRTDIIISTVSAIIFCIIISWR